MLDGCTLGVLQDERFPEISYRMMSLELTSSNCTLKKWLRGKFHIRWDFFLPQLKIKLKKIKVNTAWKQLCIRENERRIGVNQKAGVTEPTLPIPSCVTLDLLAFNL